MGEQLGGKPDSKDKGRNRANIGVVAGLAAGLAAASPAQAQDYNAAAGDYAGDSYSYEYGSEYSATPEALAVIDELNAKVGHHRMEGEQFELMNKSIDAFIAAHPAVEGKTTTTKEGVSSEPSYSPYLDLQGALLQRVEEMDPLLLGLLLQNLNARMKSIPAEKSQ